MTSISTIHTTVGTEVATTGVTFAEVAESDALTDGKTYYVICHGLVESDSASVVSQWRLVDRTNSDAVLAGSTLKREVTQANKTQGYSYIGKITAGSDGGGIAFEQSSSIGQIARTQYLSMILLDLSEMNSSDYFYATDTTSATHTTTMADRVQKTITSDPDDEWLVFGFCETSMDSISLNAEAVLYCDNPASENSEPLWSYEGEDLTEILQFWTCRVFTIIEDPSGKSVDFAIKSRDDAVGTQNTYESSSLLGLRLNAFEQSVSEYTSAETSTTATTWQELESLSITPDTTGSVLVFGASIFDGDSTQRKTYERIQVDSVTSPNSVPDSEYSANMNDGSSLIPLPYATQYTGTADTSATISLDVKKEHSADTGWLQYTLCAFSTELVSTAPITWSDVASQTYNGGDVATDNYNAGDTATEIN